MNIWIDILEKAGLGILIACVSSLITVRLAMKRFKHEALWNRKLEAYTKILEALHVTRRYREQMAEDALNYQPANEHSKEEAEQVQRAFRELQKTVDVGSLIISKEATEILNEALKEKSDDWEKEWREDAYGFFAEKEEALRVALQQILELAKRDLDK